MSQTSRNTYFRGILTATGGTQNNELQRYLLFFTSSQAVEFTAVETDPSVFIGVLGTKENISIYSTSYYYYYPQTSYGYFFLFCRLTLPGSQLTDTNLVDRRLHKLKHSSTSLMINNHTSYHIVILTSTHNLLARSMLITDHLYLCSAMTAYYQALVAFTLFLKSTFVFCHFAHHREQQNDIQVAYMRSS